MDKNHIRFLLFTSMKELEHIWYNPEYIIKIYLNLKEILSEIDKPD